MLRGFGLLRPKLNNRETDLSSLPVYDSSRTRMKQRHIYWMISYNNPTPLEFFRFITPTHKSRAIEKYGKCLDEAIDFCEDSDKESKLRNLKETINVYNQICFTYSILILYL